MGQEVPSLARDRFITNIPDALPFVKWRVFMGFPIGLGLM